MNMRVDKGYTVYRDIKSLGLRVKGWTYKI